MLLRLGPGSVTKVVDFIKRSFPSARICIITDTRVRHLHANSLAERLRQEGFHAIVVAIPPGERSKTRETKAMIEDRLLARRFGRDTVIIALGGGVVGDLAGFVAATYMRGIPYIQMPTTLLAQTDSAIGGKVGVDTATGKNMIGAFYPPCAIFIDPAFLRTLPPKEIRHGLVEMVKHGLIADASLARAIANHAQILLQPRHPRFIATLMPLLRRSIRIKLQHVDGDEHDTSGKRALLNFGHTFGHAIERASGFTIEHGDAVAIGMVLAADLSMALGLCRPEVSLQVREILSSIGAPVSLPQYLSAIKIRDAMQCDKKAGNGKARFVLLRDIGTALLTIFSCRE